MIALDVIRCEALACAGFTKEATAVSETRVAIDRLRRAYDGLSFANIPSCLEFERAMNGLLGAPEKANTFNPQRPSS